MLDQLHVLGGARLEGSVRVSGAKNAALPILMSTLLTAEPCVLHNVPDLEDTSVTERLLRSLGADMRYENGTVRIQTKQIVSSEAPYRFVKALRSSFWLLGPLIARHGSARVSLPGGDAIGSRPVDLHLRGLVAMGADIRLRNGVVFGSAPGGLHPQTIRLDYQSVGATHQLMMTAALVRGTTVIEGAACEPEVVELAEVLTRMGAHIEGAGTPRLEIQGRESLGGMEYEIEGDRIEAATFLIAGAVTGGKVTARGIDREKLRGVIEVLEATGCTVISAENSVTLSAPERLRACSFATNPYPGVATDVQPLLMAALTRADGVSVVEETVFDNRFGHVAEFRRFGADIHLDGRTATIRGVPTLSGAPVESSDIRAGAGLVLMGLAADGVTEVGEVHHLDRGYEHFVDKLTGLGARISRVPLFEAKELTVGC
ncbi:MAG: UDP-N-acetylglucosamine 1-carboxyvinyltransferase [Bdellovibrionota bacterium]